MAECLHKATLNALQAQFQKQTQASDQGVDKNFEGEKKSCTMIGAIRFLEPQE